MYREFLPHAFDRPASLRPAPCQRRNPPVSYASHAPTQNASRPTTPANAATARPASPSPATPPCTTRPTAVAAAAATATPTATATAVAATAVLLLPSRRRCWTGRGCGGPWTAICAAALATDPSCRRAGCVADCLGGLVERFDGSLGGRALGRRCWAAARGASHSTQHSEVSLHETV